MRFLFLLAILAFFGCVEAPKHTAPDVGASTLSTEWEPSAETDFTTDSILVGDPAFKAEFNGTFDQCADNSKFTGKHYFSFLVSPTGGDANFWYRFEVKLVSGTRIFKFTGNKKRTGYYNQLRIPADPNGWVASVTITPQNGATPTDCEVSVCAFGANKATVQTVPVLTETALTIATLDTQFPNVTANGRYHTVPWTRYTTDLQVLVSKPYMDFGLLFSMKGNYTPTGGSPSPRTISAVNASISKSNLDASGLIYKGTFLSDPCATSCPPVSGAVDYAYNLFWVLPVGQSIEFVTIVKGQGGNTIDHQNLEITGTGSSGNQSGTWVLYTGQGDTNCL